MDNTSRVIELIEARRETGIIDFKRDFYKRIEGSDFPKDIAAFANIATDEDRFIIFGVEDKTREIYGIDPLLFPSTDTLDNYIEKTLDPFVTIESDIFEYKGKTVGYIKICSTNDNPPYMIKKTCGPKMKLEKGDIFIRKGTCNQKAGRMDIDAMYARNGDLTVRLYDNFITVKCCDECERPEFTASLKVELENGKHRSVLISGGRVRISSGQKYFIKRLNELRSSPIEMGAGARKAHTLRFPVTPADCARLGISGNGEPEEPISCSLELYDTDRQKHAAKMTGISIYAKGDLLSMIEEITTNTDKQREVQ